MAGLADVMKGAFGGSQPGPSRGTDVDAPSAFGNNQRQIRGGADILFQALGQQGMTSRAERARKRREGNAGG